jgi:hypothetical protein
LEAIVLTGEHIDFRKLSSLLRASFASIEDTNLQIEEKSRAMSVEFLRHKYTRGEKPAKLAVIIEGGEYIACNGLLYLELNSANSIIDGWMSCDTATDPDFRGRGLFKKCLAALEASLPNESIVFGYPNEVSRSSFSKMGWENKTTYPISLSLAIPSLKNGNCRNVDFFYEPLPNSRSKFGILKSQGYLNWRYHETRANYFRLVSDDNSFALVARKLIISHIPALVVLEVIATDNLAYKNALKSARRVALKKHCLLFVISLPKDKSKRSLPLLTVRLSSKVSQRRIDLMGKPFGPISTQAWASDWDTSLGDWDAF